MEKLHELSKEYWLDKFKWVIITQRKDGTLCMMCSICMAYGPAHWKFGKLGDGGVDIQWQTMRKHALSQKHQDAINAKLRAEGGKVDQRGIEQFENDDNETSRLKQLMLVVLFICNSDSPISLYVDLVRLLAELQMLHIPDKAIGTYQSA
ncbi:unnamed protein product, partial [Closterium sp. NIES-54]